MRDFGTPVRVVVCVVAIALASPAALAAQPQRAGSMVGGLIAPTSPRTDRGIVQSVSASGIVLKVLDGTTLAIPIDGKTRVFLNGRQASILDIEPGVVAVVTYDGGEFSAPMLMISAMNGRRFGGGFLVTPQAEIDDSLLDLCLARKVSRPEILRMIPLFIRGTHTHQPAVRMVRSRRLVVESEEGLASHVDGEIFTQDARRLEIEILPRRLNIVG